MTLWLIFAVMTAAAVFAVLWPLGRKPRAGQGGSDRLVYQDQLAGDRPRSRRRPDRRGRGGIGARRNIAPAFGRGGRRGIGGGLPPAQQFALRHRVAAVAAIIVLPAIALGFYLRLGSPDVPSQSAFARVSTPAGEQSIASLVSQVEAHLASNPNDGAGWEVIAPVYLRLGRFDDAVGGLAQSDCAQRRQRDARSPRLGEALVAAANGVVTDDAAAGFPTRSRRRSA